jgi:hypothetical protein
VLARMPMRTERDHMRGRLRSPSSREREWAPGGAESAAPAQKAVPGSAAFLREVALFSRRRGVSPSPATWRLRGALASGTAQRLWMSITGSSSIRP